MSCAISQGYTRDCRDSIGGIKALYLTELGNKSTLTSASGLIQTFTLSQGKKFWTLDLEQATATASDDPQPNSANGTFYCDHKLSFRIPKRSASFSNHLKNLAVNDLMAIVLDNNGLYWLLGGSDAVNGHNGLKMQASTAPFGTAFADINGYELVFLGMEPHLALQVPSNLIATLTSPAV